MSYWCGSLIIARYSRRPPRRPTRASLAAVVASRVPLCRTNRQASLGSRTRRSGGGGFYQLPLQALSATAAFTSSFVAFPNVDRAHGAAIGRPGRRSGRTARGLGRAPSRARWQACTRPSRRGPAPPRPIALPSAIVALTTTAAERVAEGLQAHQRPSAIARWRACSRSLVDGGPAQPCSIPPAGS
jgi:hypothetical protein